MTKNEKVYHLRWAAWFQKERLEGRLEGDEERYILLRLLLLLSVSLFSPLDPHGASIYPCAESVRRSQHLSVRRIRAPYPWAVIAPTKKFTKSPSIKLLSPLFVKHHFCGLLFFSRTPDSSKKCHSPY